VEDETPEQRIARLEGRVKELEAAFEVKRLCVLVEIEHSSYYAWVKAMPAREARQAADAELAEKIRAIHTDDNTIGAPRATAELNDGVPAEERVNHKRVARVMPSTAPVATRSGAGSARPCRSCPTRRCPDLLERDFTAEAPNRKYVGDITYLPLADGTNLYLATVIDGYSRRLVDWPVADHMRTSLVEDALTAAATRGSTTALAGAIFHSDHGSVYTSTDYARLCAHLDVTQPMGRRRLQRRQRARGVVQRHAEEGGPPRRGLLARRGHLPPPGVLLDRPLQHPPTTLLVRLSITVHLRIPLRCYAPASRVIPCPGNPLKP
jgi:transposase InsO family protein